MNRVLIAALSLSMAFAGGIVCSADKPHAVIVVGTHHYSPQTTMPHLASELDRLGFRTTLINPAWDAEKDQRGLPGLEALQVADVAVFFVRFLTLDDNQLGHITRFLESGKPVVGLRTSTHAFNYPPGHAHHGLNDGFGRDVLGTPYRIHLSGKTQVQIPSESANHPILTGIEPSTWESPGTLYLVDAHPSIHPLLIGTGQSKQVGKKTNRFGTHELRKTMSAPIAWTWTNRWGGRVFNTSLGHAGDFQNPNSMRVILNGVCWAADQPVPAATTKINLLASAKPQPVGNTNESPCRRSAGENETTAGKRLNDQTSDRPNVILVMTDDQGYGDLGCHGNPILKTPHLDRLHAEAVRFTDFHVSPFCTPTRAALMTGNYPGYTGAFRTSSGRTMMHPDQKTIANLFSDAGYVTGMIGKWHLGDCAPHRPQDRGFQDVIWHRSGGIGQASDYWGNDYFDDTYERNGAFETFEGYCTDVWFREGRRFINENKDRPFLLYLALNAPHGPYRVPSHWAKPYADNKEVANPNFYGMIANIDHNIGLLRRQLTDLDLADNTILIFMTDNGTAAGGKFDGLDSEPSIGFNAGMRGKKSSVYDGGHRVPFFVHWPRGGLIGGKDIATLAAHIDVLPTLADLCDLPVGEQYDWDGVSLKPLLRGETPNESRQSLAEQFLGGAFAKALPPKPFDYSVVMTPRWRLVNSDGQQLYDIRSDPAQRHDIAQSHPDVVNDLRSQYQHFWDRIAPRLTPVRIDIGDPVENPTRLCSQDWYMPTGNPPWNFGTIRKLPKVTGPWMLHVTRAGRYRITLRQFPIEANRPVVAERARIEIVGQVAESPVQIGSTGVVFEIDLPAGPTELVTYLFDRNGAAGGAYFTDVEALR